MINIVLIFLNYLIVFNIYKSDYISERLVKIMCITKINKVCNIFHYVCEL